MPRVKQFDQQEALEKAMNLFWIKGYHATSIQDLVNHLGINRASLYDTFGGKKELFEKALDQYMKINQEASKGMLNRSENVRQTIRTMLEKAVTEILSDNDRKGCFVVNATTELAASDPDISQRALGNQRQFLSLMQSLIIKGQANGEIPEGKDARALALSMFIVFSGLRVVGKAYLSKEDVESVITPVLSMLD